MKIRYTAQCHSEFAVNYWALASGQRERLADILGCNTIATESMYHIWNKQQTNPTDLAFLPEWFLHPQNLFNTAGELIFSPVVDISRQPIDEVAKWLCENFDPEQIAEAVLREKNKDVDFNKCPECGSEDISADHFDGEGMCRDVECHGCGHEWREEYLLSGQGVSSSNL